MALDVLLCFCCGKLVYGCAHMRAVASSVCCWIDLLACCAHMRAVARNRVKMCSAA